MTAAASWGVALAPDFWTFLAAWSFQGFYVVWLPLEIALVFSRVHQLPDGAARTRRAAGILVGALEFGVIAGALAAGALVEVFAGQLQLVLLVPALAVSACWFAIRFGVPESVERSGGRVDSGGFTLLAVGLLLITSRSDVHAAQRRRRVVAVGARGGRDPRVRSVRAVRAAPGRSARGHADAAERIDVAGPADRGAVWSLGPGAQAPLSTFARTDPALHGYGLGLRAGQVSIIIGVYVLALLVGALLYPVVTRRLTPRWTLVGAASLVGLGYLLFLPFHGSLAETLANMAIAGVGSGALVAALPSAAAAAAPLNRTAMATGLTNTTKTIGGAFASAVFGIALLSHAVAEAGTVPGDGQTAAPLAGYLTVWTICGVTGLAAAAALVLVPRLAFSDRAPAAVEPLRTGSH